jgi:hypothetical protein
MARTTVDLKPAAQGPRGEVVLISPFHSSTLQVDRRVLTAFNHYDCKQLAPDHSFALNSAGLHHRAVQDLFWAFCGLLFISIERKHSLVRSRQTPMSTGFGRGVYLRVLRGEAETGFVWSAGFVKSNRRSLGFARDDNGFR